MENVYLTIDENGIITNTIVIEDPAMVEVFQAKPYYDGAKIGDNYLPPEIKEAKIAESKLQLASFLNQNPILWKDGKYYSVTQEKQALLTSNIATYQIEIQSNPGAVITWNATGEECVEWDINELCALAVAIKDYVKPMVTHQQSLEIQINACTTIPEVEAIVIDYSTVAVQPTYNQVASDSTATEDGGNGGATVNKE